MSSSALWESARNGSASEVRRGAGETGAAASQVLGAARELARHSDSLGQEVGKFLSGAFQRLSAKPTWASEGWLHKVELSGGVAVDMHVHDVDFVRYLLGDPDTVQAVASRDADGVIQEISAVYGYGKDVAVSVEAGWDYPAAFPFTATYRVRFEKAAVTFAGGAVTVYPYDGEPYQPKIEAQYHGDNAVGGNISSLGGYYNELKYFIEGIKGEEAEEAAELSAGALFMQGVATSIDALSVGFTISEYGWFMALVYSLIVAAVTFFICEAGLAIGKKFGTKLSGKASVLGGVILIGIGLEIFISGIMG